MVEPRGLGVARSAVQMGRLVRRVCVSAVAAVLAALAAGCGGAVTSPTAPTPLSASSPPPLTSAVSPLAPSLALSPASAILDGLVQHDHGADSWALGGVLVELLEGGVVTNSTTSDDNGYFHFELSAGEVQLRGSRRGYRPYTTAPITIAAGQRTITRFRLQPPFVVPAPPPVPYTEWLPRTVSGRVTDMSGKPVASASVCAVETGMTFAYACAGSDATGAYAVSFRVPAAERKVVTLDVSKPGYPKQQLPLECCASADPMVINIAMPMRVVRVDLLGPTALRVMVPVQLMALVTFEDGSSVTMKPILLDVRGTIQNSRQGSGMVEGYREGGGPAWWTYQGVTGGLVFTVTP
jgi:hypothetical protein